MTRRTFALALAALVLSLVAACGDGTDSDFFAPGTYRVRFTVPLSFTTPGALIGDHDFTFSVRDPNDGDSFTLLSSTRTSRTTGGDPTPPTTGYLDPDPSAVLVLNDQWRVQWYMKTTKSLSVRVTIVENGPTFRLPFGCNGVRAEFESFPGVNCDVERIN